MKDTKEIRELFDLYLFPIWNWSRGMKSRTFTAKEIDTYKGVIEGSTYTYARRASKAMPHFQIVEPFIAGNDFFEMVDHSGKCVGNRVRSGAAIRHGLLVSEDRIGADFDQTRQRVDYVICVSYILLILIQNVIRGDRLKNGGGSGKMDDGVRRKARQRRR